MKFKTVGLVALFLLVVVGLVVGQESKPVVPPQPDRMIYGPADLQLFKAFTRESYAKAFGVQAPRFDPARPPKYWLDSTVDLAKPDALVEYNVFSGAAIAKLTITAREAATVNMTGRVKYPEYNPAPTKAVQLNPDGEVRALLDPKMMALKSEAVALAHELECPGDVAEMVNVVFPYYYPPDEPRRIYTVCGAYTAGWMLVQKYFSGVGAPGKWARSLTGHFWIPTWEPDGADETRPPVPVPVRGLLGNEQLNATPFGVQVVRLDKVAEEDAKDGKFLPGDRALLRAIAQKLGIGQ